MHSAYSTEQARIPLFAMGERGFVRQLVGERAEELAFLFSTLDRARFEKDLAAAPEGWTELAVHHRLTGEALVLPAHVVASIAMIEAANIADQSNDGTLAPNVWVGRATTLLAKAAPVLGARLPSVLVAALGEDDEKKAIARYQEARAPGDATKRLACAKEAAVLNPCVGEPAIVAGLVARDAGSARGGGRAVGARQTHAPGLGNAVGQARVLAPLARGVRQHLACVPPAARSSPTSRPASSGARPGSRSAGASARGAIRRSRPRRFDSSSPRARSVRRTRSASRGRDRGARGKSARSSGVAC